MEVMWSPFPALDNTQLQSWCIKCSVPIPTIAPDRVGDIARLRLKAQTSIVSCRQTRSYTPVHRLHHASESAKYRTGRFAFGQAKPAKFDDSDRKSCSNHVVATLKHTIASNAGRQ
jgi:hypothetical protein